MGTAYELNVEESIEALPKAVLDGFMDMYGQNRPAWIHRSERDVGDCGELALRPPLPNPRPNEPMKLVGLRCPSLQW